MSNTTPTSAPTGQNANQRVAPLLAAIDLRDYFAAKAMQAYFTDPNVGFGSDVIEAGSQASYRIADAMLKARGQQ